MLGGICWYCHWGWSKPVRDIYNQAKAKLHGDEWPLDNGPSHVVWSDENFEEDSIRYCLQECDDPKPGDEDISPEQMAIVRWSLEELLKLPKEVREPCPADYDGENPEKYPPINGIEMVIE